MGNPLPLILAAAGLVPAGGWPVVRDKCQTCHRTGMAAPFSLTTPADVRPRAATVREAVAEGRMPPWHADPAVGRFKNDRGLTAGSTLLAWLDAGCPDDTAPATPPMPPGPDGWRIKPDLVLELPSPFAVPAAGTVPYQVFRLPTGLRQDAWVRALEVRPGNRAVVHHVFAWCLPPGEELIVDRGFLGSYLPGDEPQVLPEGYARRLHSDRVIVLQIHYVTTGKPEVDRTALGLVFAEGPLTHEVRTRNVEEEFFSIPAGAPAHPVKARKRFEDGSTLLSVTPHMHLRGKSFAADLVDGSGRRSPLLSVPRYDFNWQTRYEFDPPLRLGARASVECVGNFDNSADNPNNPDPSAEVRRGRETTDEMMAGFVDYAVPAPPGTVARKPEPTRGWLAGAAAGVLAGACAVAAWRSRRERSAPPGSP